MSVFCQVAATPYLAYETVASWRRGKSLARATVCTGCRPGKRSATGESSRATTRQTLAVRLPWEAVE
ncbi:hypothetical protein [Raoultella planticola]|uniref:hypothetical protein n=1 Tax=Raoultella planticola TaxID=575 RepID=UPI0011852BDE|nr:hypothetical protein [Raoultella planticola]